MTIRLSAKIPSSFDALAILLPERTPAPSSLPALDVRAVARLLTSGIITGKAKDLAFDLVDSPAGKPHPTFVAGLGNPSKLTLESLRIAASSLIRAAKRNNLKHLTILVPTLDKISLDQATAAITTGVLLSQYEFTQYKGTATKKPASAQPLAVTLVAAGPNVAESFSRAQIIAEATNFARTIASRPGNDINPVTLAQVATDLAKSTGLSIKILDDKTMRKLGMGGILAVGSGSKTTPPRMIILEHNPPRGRAASAARSPKSKPLLVIGKAITFDTGGISIKPAEKMGKMIFDKSGGMAVLGLMQALSKLKSKAHVVGILSSAENHVSDLAYRPGDILRMYNGVTVEVTNTDAEGRLVLGDALAWGIEQYKPKAVVDLATLTGGCVVALGNTFAGIMGNNDDLIAQLTQAGAEVGEKLWRLPIADEHRDMLKSDSADIINAAGRQASALTAAAFLSYFVPQDNSIPWAHLDIAGVADTEKELPYFSKGSTAFGVRTLVQWIESQAK